jgi:hypothetical protein
MNFVNFCGITFTSSSANQKTPSGTGCANIKCGVLPNCCWPYLQHMLTKRSPIPMEAAAQEAISLAEKARASDR